MQKYFSAVDTFDSSKNKKDKIQYPVLFRILYCCGTRINETLGIRKQDVDLDAGIIKLSETKNDCDRYIVLSDELRSLIKQYASKCFYLLNEEDYIFTLANGRRCSGDIIYEHHRMFLKKAGIPYIGNGEGPRIHDFRHTFAVNSFKQMLDTGIDIYVALPILSTYLGHKTIYATERYVRLTMSMFPYIEKQFKDKMDAVFGEANHENN
ncbi:tyrosine-type recombinase/integrase [Thermoanaerobacterium aotearoense]|uniref:tyrosine-type recombinase/integrase n=1 Tax=Thermoanaerobacterium aotearoense TaxID=47490 RepID=UPI001F15D2AF|nr:MULTISPECIES: tyrosine-type recombinase/integrase [Thermoanaerobacterium]